MHVHVHTCVRAHARAHTHTVQVQVESFQAAQELDYDLLGGEQGSFWYLQYTTASDVVSVSSQSPRSRLCVRSLLVQSMQTLHQLQIPILRSDRSFATGPLSPPLVVGPIYQRFTSPVQGEGKVSTCSQAILLLLQQLKASRRLLPSSTVD
jgi:hypothetical protein